MASPKRFLIETFWPLLKKEGWWYLDILATALRGSTNMN